MGAEPEPAAAAGDRVGPTGRERGERQHEQFVVAFSKDVTGVSTSDFAPQLSDTTGTVTDVEPLSNAIYVVTVGHVYGNGTLSLNFADIDGSVEDYTTHVALPQDELLLPRVRPAVQCLVSIRLGRRDRRQLVHGRELARRHPAACRQQPVVPGHSPRGRHLRQFPPRTTFKSIELASEGFDFGSQYALTLTGGITLDAGAGNPTISANITLSGPITIDVADAGATLTISGNIDYGSGTLTKVGPRHVEVDRAGLYGLRPTTVIDGTLELGPNTDAQNPILCGGGADVQGVNGRLVLDYTGSGAALDTKVGGLLKPATTLAVGRGAVQVYDGRFQAQPRLEG